MRPRTILMLLLAAATQAGCGRHGKPAASGIPPDLVREARPIGSGPRFRPPVTGRVPVPCLPHLGARVGVHLEVFAQNRVVLIAAGIGTKPPRRTFAGRISAAACYGSLVTIDPTGLVLLRAGARLTVADVFRAWGQPLSRRRIASFSAPGGSSVRVYVDGRRRDVAPGTVPLTPHAEIVLEVGPYVPPHSSYTFPPGT